MRCKACNNNLSPEDRFVDDREELCRRCMNTIVDDLDEHVAKKLRARLDNQIKEALNLDDLEDV